MKYFCKPNFYLYIESSEPNIPNYTKYKKAQPTVQFVAEYECVRGLTKLHFLCPICILKTQTDTK